MAGGTWEEDEAIQTRGEVYHNLLRPVSGCTSKHCVEWPAVKMVYSIKKDIRQGLSI